MEYHRHPSFMYIFFKGCIILETTFVIDHICFLWICFDGSYFGVINFFIGFVFIPFKEVWCCKNFKSNMSSWFISINLLLLYIIRIISFSGSYNSIPLLIFSCILNYTMDRIAFILCMLPLRESVLNFYWLILSKIIIQRRYKFIPILLTT